MKAADYIATFLENNGVTHVFELVGGMITFLLDSLHQHTSIKIVSMRHEQGAGFAAEGYGRMTGIPGVAMATSGPGATNLLTAIGSCYFDSTPAVFITGQVNRHEQKGERSIRQLGFQETDIVSMSRPITKAVWSVQDPEELPKRLAEAFALAVSGRPGPVLLDIPMDVQRAEVSDDFFDIKPVATGQPLELAGFAERLRQALQKAQRPLILAGGGVRLSHSAELLQKVAEHWGTPVVHSLMGVDILPASHPLRVGMIGSYGNRWANIAINESDMLIVLGSRLDIRQTGANVESFRGQRQIFHVDCEAGEMNNRVTQCDTLKCELSVFIEEMLTRSRFVYEAKAWRERLTMLQKAWPDTGEFRGLPGINPNMLMRELSAVSATAAAFVVDVGQHQMWAAQSLQLEPGQRFLTSGGMGAMGFALPASIGACLGADRRPVVMVAGDGGFQLNIQELQTIVGNGLPIKLVVMNNLCHGMVRQFQESYFKGRYQSTLWGYSAPNFAAVAGAYGIAAERVELPTEVPTALGRLWGNPSTPYLLEVMLDTRANAYPKMAFGRAISEMEPLATPMDMEGT